MGFLFGTLEFEGCDVYMTSFTNSLLAVNEMVTLDTAGVDMF